MVGRGRAGRIERATGAERERSRSRRRGGRRRRLAAVAALALGAGAFAVACEPAPLGGGGRNFLGTGTLLPGANRENRWLSVSGPCSSAEQGDLLSAVSDANFSTPANPPSSPNTWTGCTDGTTEVNPDHDARGYVYGVRVPTGYDAGPLVVEVYDGAHCSGGTTLDSSGSFTTAFTVLAPVVAGTDPRDGAVLSTVDLVASAACGSWRSLHTIEAPLAGRTYHVQVAALPATGSAQQGANQFALRARPTAAGFTPCSTDASADDHDPSCVDVHAVGWVSWFLTFSGAAPQFAAARVRPGDVGGVLQLSVWDPGEGSLGIRIVDPSGYPVAFEWEVVDRSGVDVAPTGGWSGSVAAGALLDVTGSGHPQPGPHRLSSSRYNDRLLRLRAPIPADGSGTGTWSVQVLVDSSPTDRTTWRADVLPAPPVTTTTTVPVSSTTTAPVSITTTVPETTTTAPASTTTTEPMTTTTWSG